MISFLGNVLVPICTTYSAAWKEKQMCANQNRCDNLLLTEMECRASCNPLRMETKQRPRCMTEFTLPMYHVFQPLPLLFVLLQLFPPCLFFLRAHSLEEPSLSHGFGLRRESRLIRCLQSDLRWDKRTVWHFQGTCSIAFLWEDW